MAVSGLSDAGTILIDELPVMVGGELGRRVAGLRMRSWIQAGGFTRCLGPTIRRTRSARCMR